MTNWKFYWITLFLVNLLTLPNLAFGVHSLVLGLIRPRIWCKNMRNVVLGWFWPIWPSVIPGLTSCILLEQVVVCQSRCSHSPPVKKLIFLEFRGLTRKLRTDKIQYLQLPHLYPTSQLQWKVMDEECNYAFSCPQISWGKVHCFWAKTDLTLIRWSYYKGFENPFLDLEPLTLKNFPPFFCFADYASSTKVWQGSQDSCLCSI